MTTDHSSPTSHAGHATPTTPQNALINLSYVALGLSPQKHSPGCDRPPAWCECHHIEHWSDGGDTKLHNLVMLCGSHHRILHNAGWQVRIAEDSLPEFIPPGWLDPEQVPRRDPLRQRE
jgi:hypothetical protein